MLSRKHRIALAIASVILSLPAFLGVVAGALSVYATAVLSGYQGTPIDAVVKLFSTWQGCLVVVACLLSIVHIGLFIHLVIGFARGHTLPVLAQVYCVMIVLFAVGERIRLSVVDGNAFFWFGAFSLPHALCLFAIIRLGTHSSQLHAPQRTEAIGTLV
jgi:hypothetical protein